MTSRKLMGAFAVISLFTALFCAVWTGFVMAGAYNPCRIPPVVGSATKPNVMIVMDYSGSMQFPAYTDYTHGSYYSSHVAYPSTTTPVTAEYDPRFQYYGTFDPDTYYVYDTAGDYFVKADPQPVSYYTGTAETEDGGGGTIWLTCDGHDFQVNDYVAVYDLGSHKNLNGDGHQVLEVSGSKFKISATWNGKPDPVGYKAIKRITGNVNVGISGNVLNMPITSRIDAAVKALIGGKATTVSGDTDNVYVQAQGARRWVTEATNVNAQFYMRPATLESSSTFPDDYQTGSYTDKDMFVTISGKYSGQLDPNDPNRYNKRVEPWTFTLTRTTQVSIRIQSTWSLSYGVRLAIYDNSSINNPWLTDVNGKACSSSVDNTQTTTLTVTLGAGTYYLRVATNDETIPNNEFTASYDLWSTVPLQKHTGLYTEQGLNPVAHQGQALTKIGAIPWARVRIKVPKEERQGLIQEAFPYVRFGFTIYKGVTNAYGKILVGCHNDDVDKLVKAIEGKSSGSSEDPDFTIAYPYSGTPTGEALREAQDYFTQTNTFTYSSTSNTSFIAPGTLKDPYYSADSSGTPMAAPCRKSFVLLISDGEWNGSVDPATVARTIHTSDLRDLPGDDGDQSVNMYSIYAFSTTEEGERAMKSVAMYGSFTDDTTCGTVDYPYPKDSVPNSLSMAWPIPECNPNGTYNDCCKEWNKVWDRDGDGTNESKGVPDKFYKASNGKELQEALEAVLADVVTRHASASAVATVSQELRSGDIIVRGVFEAADPDKVNTYLWKGHLEAFWPLTYNNEEIYSFELACNAGMLCVDMPGSDAPCPSLGKNCFDAGYILSNYSKNTGWKLITFDQDTKDQIEFDNAADGLAALGKVKLDCATDTEATNLLTWVLGGSVSGLRDRHGWLLGDIVFSTPVVLGPPGLGEVSKRDPNITEFYEHRNRLIEDDPANEHPRPKIVYVGANDGMLHAIMLGKYDSTNDKWIYDPAEDSEIGKELWAYVPSNLLSELNDLASSTYGAGGCDHRTMVDLAPRSWEVYIDPRRRDASGNPTGTNPCGADADEQGRCWRSVIVGGERGGGDVYFAIDVTDPRNPRVLWEYSVLKNRVVVEAVGTSTNPDDCINECRNQCANDCEAQRVACRAVCDANYTGQARKTCRTNCDNAKQTCINTCEGNCVTDCSQASIPYGYKAFVPFRAAYDSIKMLPMSWSQPYLGRIKLPVTQDDDENGTGLVKFYVGDPSPLDMTNGGDPVTLKQFDAPNHRRSVVFMGGGIHLYDKSFDTTPTVPDRFKLALFWPFFLMMDIETGHNLFEYVWPMIVNQNAAKFPYKYGLADDDSGVTIPYAMSDPVALDVWNQEEDVVGDDGYIDRIYVGDMTGNVYGIKFNLDPQVRESSTSTTLVPNSDFGIYVDLWPTKPILSGDLYTNKYRADRQPITISLATTFDESSSDHLRVIIGTGKYDDVYLGDDDKADTARMSLYNLKDPIALPSLSSGYEIYDSSHRTGFKVAFEAHCTDKTFRTGCTWAKAQRDDGAQTKVTVCSDPSDLSTCQQVAGSTSPDCCEGSTSDTCSSPCYECVYDFTLPSTSTYPGERVVGKPLIAGGLIFLTTFVPPHDPCGYTGEGYLYAFSADCVPIIDPNSVFSGSGTAVGAVVDGSGRASGGIRYSLGSGIPSKPVLDSRGENLIIQMSDGTLKRVKVDLPVNPISVKGWRVR